MSECQIFVIMALKNQLFVKVYDFSIIFIDVNGLVLTHVGLVVGVQNL